MCICICICICIGGCDSRDLREGTSAYQLNSWLNDYNIRNFFRPFTPKELMTTIRSLQFLALRKGLRERQNGHGHGEFARLSDWHSKAHVINHIKWMKP